jgi:hypothetical protein
LAGTIDASYVPDRPYRYLAGFPARGRPGRIAMAKHRVPKWENVEKLITLLVSAVDPVARLISAISRIR